MSKKSKNVDESTVELTTNQTAETTEATSKPEKVKKLERIVLEETEVTRRNVMPEGDEIGFEWTVLGCEGLHVVAKKVAKGLQHTITVDDEVIGKDLTSAGAIALIVAHYGCPRGPVATQCKKANPGRNEHKKAALVEVRRAEREVEKVAKAAAALEAKTVAADAEVEDK